MSMLLSTRRALLGGKVAEGCGLLDNLIAYWPGDEAAGNLIDAHTNGLDLTDNNTVTSNPGHVYATARQYTVANLEYHVRPGDDALLSMGDVDVTWAAWVYLDSKGSDRAILSKYRLGAGPSLEYYLVFNNTGDSFQLYVRDMTNTFNKTIDATTFGSPSTGTWYLVIAYHDAVDDKLGICVNNGTVDTTDWSLGIRDAGAYFAIGAMGLGPTNYWNGRIGPTAVWKSAAGGGGVLTAAQRTCLWNGGAGLKYTELT